MSVSTQYGICPRCREKYEPSMYLDGRHNCQGASGKHTPGPWSVSGSLIVAGGSAVVARVTHNHATRDAADYHPESPTWPEGADANAALIAAAPDLLTALKRLEFAARARENRAGDPCGHLEAVAELEAAAKAAREVITKADNRLPLEPWTPSPLAIPQVLIEVTGGCAYFETNGQVEVFLVDYDNEPDAELPEEWRGDGQVITDPA